MVGQWLPWCHGSYTEEDATAWVAKCKRGWETGEEYEFAFFHREGEFLGAGGLNAFLRLHNFANLGYWVRQSRQRQAIAAEVIRLLTQFGLETLGLARIEIVTVHDNFASRRTAEESRRYI